MLTRQSFEAWVRDLLSDQRFICTHICMYPVHTFLDLIYGCQKLQVPGSDKTLTDCKAKEEVDSLHVPLHQHVLAGTTQNGIEAIEGKAQGHASILRHGEDLDRGCRVGNGPQGNIPPPSASHKHLLVGAVA